MKLENSIEIDGNFWLEAALADSRSTSGCLTIDNDGSSQLRLPNNIGNIEISKIFSQCILSETRLSAWITGQGHNGELIWLHVYAEDMVLMTRGCLPVKTVFIHKSLPMFQEICTDRPSQIAFDRFTCEIEGVWEWLGVSGFQYPVDVAQWYWGDRKAPLEVRYQCPSIEFLESRQPLKWDDNKPKVSISFKISPAPFFVPPGPEFTYPKFVLEENTTIEVTPESGSFGVSDVVDHLLILRNFFAISMDMPVNVVQCNVSTVNANWGQVDGKPITNLSMYHTIGRLHGKPFRRGKHYVRIDRANRVGKHGHLWPRLTAWYDHYNKREYAIEEYLDGRFQNGPVSAPRVMALWRAMEALAGTNKKPIKDTLHHILKSVIKDNNERCYWVLKINRIRGGLAHGDNKRRPSLDELAVAYTLFIIAFNFCILTDMGMEADNLLSKDDRVGQLHYLDTGMSIRYLRRCYADIVTRCNQLGNKTNLPMTICQIRQRLRLEESKEGEELEVVLNISGWKKKDADTWLPPCTSH